MNGPRSHHAVRNIAARSGRKVHVCRCRARITPSVSKPRISAPPRVAHCTNSVRCYSICAMRCTVDGECRIDGRNHVGPFVGGRAIDTERYPASKTRQTRRGRNARTKTRIGLRAMRHARTRLKGRSTSLSSQVVKCANQTSGPSQSCSAIHWIGRLPYFSMHVVVVGPVLRHMCVEAQIAHACGSCHLP